MTVIVGILCQDGVVIGSDSSATFGPRPGQFTIEQPVKKTFVAGNVFLHAGTGQIGLAQRFHAILEGIAPRLRKESILPIDLGKQISAATVKDFASTGAKADQFGALVAYVAPQKQFGLIEFATLDFQPEIKTTDLWFAAMGSGQPIVDPFFGLLRGALFKKEQPKLSEGIFAAVWALQHVIDLNAGGINGPIQLGVVAKDRTDRFVEARLLTEEELAEHKQNVLAMTEYVAAYRDRLSGKPVAGTDAPPSPPVPPTTGATVT